MDFWGVAVAGTLHPRRQKKMLRVTHNTRQSNTLPDRGNGPEGEVTHVPQCNSKKSPSAISYAHVPTPMCLYTLNVNQKTHICPLNHPSRTCERIYECVCERERELWSSGRRGRLEISSSFSAFISKSLRRNAPPAQAALRGNTPLKSRSSPASASS